MKEKRPLKTKQTINREVIKHMKNAFVPTVTGSVKTAESFKSHRKIWIGAGVGVSAALALSVGVAHLFASPKTQAVAPAAPIVAVSHPVQKQIDQRLQFLGQFAGVDEVELRAQVGGTLKQINFKDGEVVKKGDLLFVIDPTPYEIKMSHAKAQLDAAQARLELASREFTRAETLKKTDAGTTENVERKAAEKLAAQAALDGAKALVRDAQFDLDHTQITAPFTGRIGTHLVSKGNLVAGSRAGAGPTTLLATLVSLSPIYLNFEMSENDYLAFSRERAKQNGPMANNVNFSLSDETDFNRQGSLDFVDNVVDRSSGTIRVRATVPNDDHLLTPGAFARVRLAVASAAPALLVPDAAVFPDQTEHVVLTVGADDTVAAKHVKLGDIRDGLRVIRSGLAPTDRVIVDGMATVRPGTKVNVSEPSKLVASNL